MPPKHQKKVYTEAIARISFTASEVDAQRICDAFLARKGIELETISRSPQWRELVIIDMTVKYRVHGGWRSDFLRKLQIDAQDLGLDLDFTVNVERREIPRECPRKECVPCETARRMQDRGQLLDDIQLYGNAYMTIKGERIPPEAVEPVGPDTLVPRKRFTHFRLRRNS